MIQHLLIAFQMFLHALLLISRALRLFVSFYLLFFDSMPSVLDQFLLVITLLVELLVQSVMA